MAASQRGGDCSHCTNPCYKKGLWGLIKARGEGWTFSQQLQEPLPCLALLSFLQQHQGGLSYQHKSQNMLPLIAFFFSLQVSFPAHGFINQIIYWHRVLREAQVQHERKAHFQQLSYLHQQLHHLSYYIQLTCVFFCATVGGRGQQW